MIRHLVFTSLMVVIILLVPFSRAGDDKQPAAPETSLPPPIRLAVQATARPATALHYRLLPEPLERTPGNAAPLWQEAMLAERGKNQKISPEEDKWSDRREMPLKNLPRPAVQAFLARHAVPLRLARQAARREYCDWQQPELTFQNLQDLIPGSIQGLRTIAFLLSVQCRYQLAERRFDDAIDTLRTGFALARHIGNSQTLIQELVAIAIAQIMLGRVEEWLQIPGSPNLYWPLTALPKPLLDVRQSMESELNTLYRSLPQLRELHQTSLTVREVDHLLEKLFHALNDLSGSTKERGDLIVMQKLGIAVLAAKVYPEGRKSLLDQGHPAKEVDAMPMAQVALIYFLDQYDRMRDDILKWLALPSWQALPALTQMEKDMRTVSRNLSIFSALMPAFSKIYAAKVRLEMNIASLRCAEALRLHAAAHEGQPPAKWSDLTLVPLPLDPATGKGFDAFYQVKDGRAILDVPPLPGQGTQTRRRFELATKR